MHFDLIVKNAKIITMDASLSEKRWLAIKDGKIAALGDRNDCPDQAAEFLDLSGKTILPGLFDSHIHVMPSGLALNSVSLSGLTCIEDVLSRLEAACRKSSEEWVFATGFLMQGVKEQRYPTRQELDDISCGHSIIILAATLHACCVNTPAMPTANVPSDLPGVQKQNGEPTGAYLSDESAFLALSNIIGSLSDEVLWKWIEDCARYASSKGVTAISGLFGQFGEGDRDVCLILEKGNALPIHVNLFYQTWDVEMVKSLHLPRIGGCLTLDGAAFEYTMATFEPYTDHPELRGVLYHTDEEVYQLISKANAEGMQCSMHAVGERAIDQLLYAYRRVLMEQGDQGLRHRLEHFCLPTQGQVEMASELGIILSMQPGFYHLWDKETGGDFEPLLGRPRTNRMDPYPAILKAGGMICTGSDSPVTMVEPLVDIATCVRGANPVRNVSVSDAIKFGTINGAYANGLERQKGSLEIGKDADLVVIDRDPYACANSDDIYHMQVDMTLKGGCVVHQRGKNNEYERR